ncbi:hypothetical protein AKO1_013967 [Acrasis kona]|uniref:F-box domain-containing protein n=1 Tax=Acrasis kona TaxID=1008807 RepID=A0AAW2Z456_9EUKA
MTFLDKGDVLRVSLTCREFREAAVRDTVWTQILSSDIEQYFITSCHYSEHSAVLQAPKSPTSIPPNRSNKTTYEHYIQLNKDFREYVNTRRPKITNVDKVLLLRDFCEKSAPYTLSFITVLALLSSIIFLVLLGLYSDSIIPRNSSAHAVVIFLPLFFVLFALVPSCVVVSYCTIGSFPYISPIVKALFKNRSSDSRLLRVMFYDDVQHGTRMFHTALSFSAIFLWIPMLIVCCAIKEIFFRNKNIWSFAMIPVYLFILWGMFDFLYRIKVKLDFSRPRRLFLSSLLMCFIVSLILLFAVSIGLIAAWADKLINGENTFLIMIPSMMSFMLLTVIIMSPFIYKIILSNNAGRRQEVISGVVGLLFAVFFLLPIFLFIILMCIKLQNNNSIGYIWVFSPLYFGAVMLLSSLVVGTIILYRIDSYTDS